MLKFTKETAEAEASSRNKAKGKQHAHMQWIATQDSLGWLVKLVPLVAAEVEPVA